MTKLFPFDSVLQLFELHFRGMANGPFPEHEFRTLVGRFLYNESPSRDLLIELCGAAVHGRSPDRIAKIGMILAECYLPNTPSPVARRMASLIREHIPEAAEPFRATCRGFGIELGTHPVDPFIVSEEEEAS